MIENININNYALIDRTELCPGKGFTVITGETGAGKSILLGAIGLTLGQRADTTAIMDRSRKCVVEITYRVGDYHLQNWFEENDLDYSDQVVVRREITGEGKSRGFINDTPVSNRLLRDFGHFMVDIHSQHQSLILGQPEYQIEVLDSFCGNGNLLEKYREQFDVHRKLTGELKELKGMVADAEKESDYLKFRFDQLESARLQSGEKEMLEKELKLLSHSEHVKSVMSGIGWNLRDSESAVIGVLKSSRNSLADIGNVLDDAEEYRQRLDSVIIELNDLADEAERKAEDIEYNPGKIEEINSRLNIIYDLLFKFKAESVEELIDLRNGLKERLRQTEVRREDMEILEKRIKQSELLLEKLSVEIHEVRSAAVGSLCAEMKRLLMELGIRHAMFTVELSLLDHFTYSGKDDVKFLFAANKNQEPGEIAKVASGGEISRVMLALKYVLSGTRKLPVIVFDEIDSGLSGEVAHRMAGIMREMSGRMQVISISHLPQIAAAGDCHFKVYKEDNSKATVSRIRLLTDEERIMEVAGMISGQEISPAAIETARNLLQVKIGN